MTKFQCLWDADVGGVSEVCHMHKDPILTVIPCLAFFFEAEEVRTAVTLLCISDVQGAVIEPQVPRQVESALLLLHESIWVVCSHQRRKHFILFFVVPVPKGKIRRHVPGFLSEFAGHEDTQTLLHRNRIKL